MIICRAAGLFIRFFFMKSTSIYMQYLPYVGDTPLPEGVVLEMHYANRGHQHKVNIVAV